MKYLLLASLLIYGNLSYGQVYKFKAFNTYWSIYNTETKVNTHQDSAVTDFLVVVDLNKKLISTYGQKEGKIDILTEALEDRDDKGNYLMEYDAIDQFGKKCVATFQIYKEPTDRHVANLIIFYVELHAAMVLRLKNDE